MITSRFGKQKLTGFLVPLPSRPSKEFFDWSQWLPSVADDNPVAGGFRYRFRIQPTYREKQEADKARLDADRKALESLKSEEIASSAAVVFRERADEIGPLAHHEDPPIAMFALKSIRSLNSIPEFFDPHLRQAATGIADAIRQYEKNYDSKDPDTLTLGEIHERYSAWHTAGAVHSFSTIVDSANSLLQRK